MAQQAAAWPAEIVGWKVALGAPAAQQQAGISGPVAGFLTEPRPSGAILPVDGGAGA